MPSNKDRLYVALYARGGQPRMPGGEDKYHWAFITGPKVITQQSAGRRIHAKERMGQSGSGSHWEYENRSISMLPTAMILVRVVVGKIEDNARLISIMESVPVRGNQPGWNCVEWLKEALELLGKDKKALGTSVTDWKTVRDGCMQYVQTKAAQHRFDGQAPGKFDDSKVATYDLLERKEIQE
ncbi:hypothetical protein GE09DRAFT_611771 [Coniochaeta sp. 2T2.1]|nr:hypothetical protein GE09DRAFT_611771 [Coniochaeta sp. 2T2.1]